MSAAESPAGPAPIISRSSRPSLMAVCFERLNPRTPRDALATAARGVFRRLRLILRVRGRVELGREISEGDGLVRLAVELFEYVEAEHSVALELRLVEELVGRRLVREVLVALRGVEHVARLVAVDGGLDVDELAGFAARVAVHPFVVYVCDGAVSARLLLKACGARGDVGLLLEPDVYAEVYANLPHRAAEVVVRARGVCRAVHDEDVTAAPQDHLVEAEVLEVAAVGEEHVRVAVVGHPERLVDDGAQCLLRVRAEEGLRAVH